jgi:hypothetical protein
MSATGLVSFKWKHGKDNTLIYSIFQVVSSIICLYCFACLIEDEYIELCPQKQFFTCGPRHDFQNTDGNKQFSYN